MEAKIAEFAKLFDEADKGKDGLLKFEEFNNLIKKVNGEESTIKDTEALFRGADVDGSKGVNKTEFVGLVKSLLGNDKVELTKVLFRAHDKDRSGTLETAEIKSMFEQFGKQITDDEAKKVIEDHGVNGKLDFPSLCKALFNVEVPKGTSAYPDKKSSKCCLLI